MDAWLRSWLEATFDPRNVETEDFGALPLAGEIAVWHPVDDLYQAPRIPFATAPRLDVVRVGGELAAYALHAGDGGSLREIGDASTSADRFFLVEVERFEQVIAWLNEDPFAFEALGGERPVETVEHANGARMVVIQSPDGNARVSVALDGNEKASGALITL